MRWVEFQVLKKSTGKYKMVWWFVDGLLKFLAARIHSAGEGHM